MFEFLRDVYVPIFTMAALLSTKNCCRRVTQLGVARIGTSAVANSAVSKIGNREIVGHGFNGEASYIDRADFPFPAVRFREPSEEFKVWQLSSSLLLFLLSARVRDFTKVSFQALLEKEKGDWKNLSLDEKKALYRFSFCQTLAELKAPTGEWKACIGYALIMSSLAIWMYVWLKVYGKRPL